MEREIIEQEIELKTESIIPFPKDDYYTKYEVDDLLDDKADENVVNEILLDISSIEDEQILQNNSITNLGNDITSINGDIQEIESDMNNLSLITETGSQIALNISTSDYKMTAILKDKNGNVIYTSNEIDLPLESVVVNGRYDSVSKKIILTLQNGNEIEFSVADLVSGLQSEITSSNKLSSDLVDDTNNNNKFVSSQEKTTWNSKQEELISGTNIKTINNESLLGQGNISISTTELDPIFSASASAGITSNDITNWNNKSNFSGDYNDLTNKPTIPTVPTNISSFINDVGYITQDVYFQNSATSSEPFVLDGKKRGLYLFNFKYDTKTFYFKTKATETIKSASLQAQYLYLYKDVVYDDLATNEIFGIIVGVDSNGVMMRNNIKKTTNPMSSGSELYTVLKDVVLGQGISGKKIFYTIPECSLTPTTNNQLVNKSYVDGTVGDINTVLSTLVSVGGNN